MGIIQINKMKLDFTILKIEHIKELFNINDNRRKNYFINFIDSCY